MKDEVAEGICATAAVARCCAYGKRLLLVALLAIWHVGTSPTLLPPLYFDNPDKAAFFFGEPLTVLSRIWNWFYGGEIYRHLWVTLVETFSRSPSAPCRGS